MARSASSTRQWPSTTRSRTGFLSTSSSAISRTGRGGGVTSSGRIPRGLELLVELAELLQAPVSDRRMRMNFPTRHPLYDSGNVASADLILALEVPDLYHVTHALTPVNRMGMEARPLLKPGTKIV